jgi:hypothetical protein
VALKAAIQNPLKPPTHDRHGFVSSPVELLANRGQCCAHALLGGLSHDLKLSLLIGSKTMRESQKVESLRLALRPLAHALNRMAAKLCRALFSGCRESPSLASGSRSASTKARAVLTASKPTNL